MRTIKTYSKRAPFYNAFTRHVKYGFSQFRCFALPKRRQIKTIEKGQSGVRATCALVTSEELDCSGKPKLSILICVKRR
jgi:hypothetical protein